MLRGGVGGGSGLALVVDHALDDVAGSAGVADAETGHGIGLAHAADQNGAGLDLRAEGGDGIVLLAAVDQLFIDFVGHDVEIVLHGQIRQLLKLLARPHAAVGVGGRVEDESLGARGDELFKIRHQGQKSLTFRTVQKYGYAPGHAHHLRVADPAGLIDDHFVAGVQDGLKGVIKRVLGAVGDDDLIHAVDQAVVLKQARGNGAAQFQRARRRCVAGHPQVHGFLHGFADGGGGFKIRLSCGKADHVDTLAAQLLGLGIHGQGCGGGDGAAFFGQSKRHGGFLPVAAFMHR